MILRALAVVFIAVVASFGSASAQGQSPPPGLAGELLGAECSAFPPSGFTCVSAGQGTTATSCTPQPDGTEVVSFTVTNGVATGPYPGTFNESGTFTLGPAGSGGGGVGEQVIGFSSTFSIQSSAGTVTGTKTGGPGDPAAHNFCAGLAGQSSTFAGELAATYDATITTPQGPLHDTGQTLAQVNGGMPPSTPAGFFEHYLGPPTPPGPSPVQAFDFRHIGAVVGPDVSSVLAGTNFTGKERWLLELHNDTAPPLTGAQISVNSAYDLTDPNLFRFTGQLQTSGGTPGPPTEVPCSVTQHDAACPPSPSSQALPTGTILSVNANSSPPPTSPPSPPTPPWLNPGVAMPMTPGFDSTVSESPFSGGTATVHVLVTVRDTSRYGNGSQIMVNVDGNPVPGSGTVTDSSGNPVPPCAGPPGPSSNTCFFAQYGPPRCNDSSLGRGAASLVLNSPQMNQRYDFASTQTATPTCPNPPVRAHIRVDMNQFCGDSSCGGGSGVTNTVTIPDPDLQGSVTYRFNEPTQIQSTQVTFWSVDYLPIARPAKIAFASNRDGNFEIYSMNADGTNQTRLTNNPAQDVTPAFSADGTKIAFESTRTGNGDIYVMNADGSGVKQLTSGPAIDGAPSFSPDGTKIAFSSFRSGNGDIYVMNADGSGLTRLTTSPYVDWEPSWSSEGTKILFTSGRTGNGDVYVMNADGTNQTRLTTSNAIDSSPAWSLDGTKIFFASNRDGNFEIYSMNADGSAQTRLTNNAAFDGDPTFVSNGKVAFTTNRDGNFEIYSTNPDGTGPARLTNNPAVDVSPAAP